MGLEIALVILIWALAVRIIFLGCKSVDGESDKVSLVDKLKKPEDQILNEAMAIALQHAREHVEMNASYVNGLPEASKVAYVKNAIENGCKIGNRYLRENGIHKELQKEYTMSVDLLHK